ncbi:MAG: histidine kinase [Lachnospiraceae bacterium]|nr:histidine kinase [Lachnospiraceae bacterium]
MGIINRIGFFSFVETVIEISFLAVLVAVITFVAISFYRDRKISVFDDERVPYTKELLVYYILVLLISLSNVMIIFFGNYKFENLVLLKKLAILCFFSGINFNIIYFLALLIKFIFTPLDLEKEKKQAKIIMVIQIFLVISIFVNLSVGYFFEFDGKVFMQKLGYCTWYFEEILVIIYIYYEIFKYRKKMNPFLRRLLIIILGIPIFSLVLNFMIPRFNLRGLIFLFLVILSFFYYENYRTVYIAGTLNELDKMQTKLMLSQMKPHFLYNSLTAIIYYSDKDSVKTKKALTEFAGFLRGNMEFINEELISFDKELKYTRNYLYLEKLRFEDDLEIEYNIEVTDFLIPMFTVQTLVENSVRHGIRKKKRGKGKVSIVTKKGDNGIIIEIKDNGVGFDVDSLETLGEDHIGIRNVRKRLDYETGGTITFESEKNVGTTCTITIPKNGGVRTSLKPYIHST